MKTISPEANQPNVMARDKALKLLSIRNRSHEELKQRLRSYGFSDHVTNQALISLSKQGLIDDRRFAFERAKTMGKTKGWGPRKISYDLKNKGIGNQMIDEALSQAYEPHGRVEVMRRLVKKRLGKRADEMQSDRKLNNRMQRYLVSKGFEPEEVWEVLSFDTRTN